MSREFAVLQKGPVLMCLASLSAITRESLRGMARLKAIADPPDGDDTAVALSQTLSQIFYMGINGSCGDAGFVIPNLPEKSCSGQRRVGVFPKKAV